MNKSVGFTIQKATAADMGLLMQWRMEVLHNVFNIPQDIGMNDLLVANKEYYRATMQNETHLACFAKRNGEVIGCGGVCLFREMPSPDNLSGNCAYLMNIYTRPEHRHKGVGREIVAWLLAQAKARKITKIYLESSDCAKSLYKKMGFVPMKNYLILESEQK
jgi:GNAT superfamily N-acetyltransferase